ncbi:MAG: hypothetical protein ACOYKA_06735 [Legionellaceae bacterium]
MFGRFFVPVARDTVIVLTSASVAAAVDVLYEDCTKKVSAYFDPKKNQPFDSYDKDHLVPKNPTDIFSSQPPKK